MLTDHERPMEDFIPGLALVEERTDYFNELALFLDTTRNGQSGRMSARAITHVDMYKLRKERFEAVVHDYPSASLSIAEAAHATGGGSEATAPLPPEPATEELASLVPQPAPPVLDTQRAVLTRVRSPRREGAAQP